MHARMRALVLLVLLPGALAAGCGGSDAAADAGAADGAVAADAGTPDAGEPDAGAVPPLDWCDGKPPDAACYASKRDPSSEGVVLAKAIADRYIETYPVTGLGWDWGPSVLMFSLTELHRVTGEARYRDYYKAWIDRHITGGYTIATSDTCAPSLVAAVLYMDLGDPGYKAVVDDALDYLDNRALRTKQGGINHLGTSKSLGITLWLDSLFMFGELLTRWGEFTGDASRLDMIGEQFAIFTRLLQSDGGFYVHAYGWQGEVDTDIYWGRGNGWVTAAGYDYLRARQVRGETDAAVAGALARQVAAMAPSIDAASGLWWTILNRPGETYLETSAGALFAYGMARAHRYGLLDASVLPLVGQAMAGVRSRVVDDADGKPKVTGVSGPTMAGTFDYYKGIAVEDDLGYGVGAVILSLIETSGLPETE